MTESTELLQIADELEKLSINPNEAIIQKLQDAAEQVGKSWSRSWIGYHSRVYYKDLIPVPPGAHFSVEWGFGDRISNETVGDWAEYGFDDVVCQIFQHAGSPNEKTLDEFSVKVGNQADDIKSRILSIFSRIRELYSDDKFIEDIKKKVRTECGISYRAVIDGFRGKNQWFTRDMMAVGEGVCVPPHLHVLALVITYKAPFIMCFNLSRCARQVGSHIASLERKPKQSARIGTHVFIGHGRSIIWKEFRDFIGDRIRLPWDEFNRVPIAGIPTSNRLMEMLNQAAIAFLIFTAEDEQPDGKCNPRMNVIHEAGLFQGRLGFEKAIILLEDGCEEFSNIHGLGQIRFPKGNISQSFEEVRRILERENLIITNE